MMQKLLYIGHSYHNKTKSTAFLKEMLAKYYDIEILNFDPYTDNMKTHFKSLKGKDFDVVVLFQIMPSLDKLKKYIKFKHCAFFPMYDGVPPRDNTIWYEYRDVNIINFSKTLHDELKGIGFSSYYFQYFPKPIKVSNWGDEKSIFFWQRINKININTLEQLIDFKKIKHIHFHHAIDPMHEFVEPSESIAKKATNSTWFDTREDMQEQMQKSAIYIAPREYEGIGMSFLEAIAMGRCVIAPNYPTMNEYITNGENGILYDLNNLEKLDLSDIKKIQKRTQKYIIDGYKQWEQCKWKIIDILTTKPVINSTTLRKKYLTHKKPELNHIYKLFGILPILQVVGKPDRLMYKLFGILPVVLIRGGESRKRVYLFGIPVLKIKTCVNSHTKNKINNLPSEIHLHLQETKKPVGRVLIVFHLNFLRRDRGCSNYTYEIAKMFKKLGYAVDFFSADLFGYEDFNDIKKLNDAEHLIDNFYFSNWRVGLSDKEVKRQTFTVTELMWSNDIVRHYFEKIVMRNKYLAINIHYIQWSRLVENKNTMFPDTKLIYTCQDTNFNQVLYNNMDKNIKNMANIVSNAMRQEIEYFDLFDSIMFISYDEMLFWQKFFPNKEKYFVPYPLDEIQHNNTKKDIDLLYLAAYNPYNLHGLQWFVDKVMPFITDRIHITICGKLVQFLKQNDPKYVKKLNNLGFDLIDFADDLNKLYARVKVVIVPLYEGTGMKIKIIEAMSHNIPIVSRRPGVDGFPDKTNNGILVTDNPKEFAEIIKHLLKDNNFYKDIKNKEHEYFCEIFSKSRIEDAIQNVFIIKNKRNQND